jgi:type II secretory pathway pseudopilin PulG
MQFLTTTLQQLRLDWAAVDTVLVIAALSAVTVLLQAQLRRLRRQSTRDLQRVFELLDLMRLDAQEQLAMAPTINPPVNPPLNGRGNAASSTPATPPTAAAPPAAHASAARDTDEVDYRAAARLAERGTSMREIAERCGLVSGEARVLVALQQARAKRAVHA